MNNQIDNLINEILYNLEDLEEALQNNKNITVCEAICKEKLYYQEILTKLIE
jgi:hypothetical protein